ncbi:piggyBac transposable element-derived protein 4-like protein [Lates japonicus]|uniref:PiggyBac transposable element-derived protein 4-like protein n=1 Tax=Lates japonicus TaxID=270547 RepID=A0AAD3RGR5_LATJO|nr:piggyBac transposable element-derived protein 4-like protein [Lates japonicus]
MAARRPTRIPEDLARQMIPDGWNEEPIGGIDSGSDISDAEDPDYCPPGDVRPPGNQPPPTEQDQSDTEESSDESSEEEMDIVSNRMSLKGSYWAELPPIQAKTQSHNILRSRSGPAPGFSTISPIDAWKLFITDNIIEEVLTSTNMEGRRVAPDRGKEWKNVSKVELMAFIGLTILAGGEKNWDVPICELFGRPLHNPMYKATMSIGRFEDIRRFLRFDDKRTRAYRLETDHMAAFRYIWDLFLINCRQKFIPSDCVTVDEQLVPFRGRTKFLQYMPSKPAKYGIKIFWVCDARTPYAIDGIVYTGRQPGEEVQKNLGENIVRQLCSGFRHTGRNITTNRWAQHPELYTGITNAWRRFLTELSKELVTPHMKSRLEVGSAVSCEHRKIKERGRAPEKLSWRGRPGCTKPSMIMMRPCYVIDVFRYPTFR